MSVINFSLVPAKQRTAALIEDALYEADAIGNDLSSVYSSDWFVNKNVLLEKRHKPT